MQLPNVGPLLIGNYENHTNTRNPSPQLMKFLESSSIIGDPSLKDAATWRLFQEYFEKGTQEVSDAAKAKYIDNTIETKLANVPVLIITPKIMPLANENKVIMYLHGGAFTLGSPKHLYQVFSQIAYETGVKVIAVDYSLAPEHPFPIAINECVAVYQEILKTYDQNNIVFLGDSAGGNLCLATCLVAKEKQISLPRALALLSPATNARKGPSYESNKDPRISYECTSEPAFRAYCDDFDQPLFTVLNADLSGLPSIFIQTGTRDAIESDGLQLAEKVNGIGGTATCISLPHVPHGIVEQSDDIPESVEARHITANFIKTVFN